MNKTQFIEQLQKTKQALETSKEQTESTITFVKLDSQIKLLTNIIAFAIHNLDDESAKKEGEKNDKRPAN